MTALRNLLSIATLTTAALVTSICIADEPHSGSGSAHTAPLPITQTITRMGVDMHAGTPSLAYAEQMKAMAVMHEQMFLAKTPEERNALMSSQMRLMQDGMRMMGGMGNRGHMADGAMMGAPGDDAYQQERMEQRMDMLQSMMQLMMDRMQPLSTTK